MSEQAEKLCRLLSVIVDSKSDIDQITKGNKEYYFYFRGRVFSIAARGGDASAGFYVYPKWDGSPRELRDIFKQGRDSDKTEFVYLSAEDAVQITGMNLTLELYSWLNDKELGLDQLFSEFGID